MNTMTTDQALQMLDQAVASMQLTRDQHGNLQMALHTLGKAVASPVEDAKKATEPKKKKK